MRVTLINPPPHQCVDEFDTPNFTRLGLASLAATLRARGLAKVEIIDAKFERLSDDAVLERVRRFAPDLVALTALTNEIKPAARVAGQVKRLSSSIVTVVGGVHPTVLPERTMTEFPVFDVAVMGEGEVTFAEVVSVLGRGESLAEVQGLCVRDGEGSFRTAQRPRVVDLDTLPLPAWDLLPRSPRYLLMTQRGCAFRCKFCVNPNGPTVRARSVDNVMAELTEIVERGGDQLYICDELFTVDRERTHRLLDAMLAAGFGRRLRWMAQTHVNLVDRELFTKMKAAGCYVCSLGIETGDPGIMDQMKKGFTMEGVIAARTAAREAGLAIEGLMIIGHPNETWSTAMRSIDFTAQLNPERPIIGIMVPYPGTEVARMAANGEGGYRLLSTDWNDYGKQIGNALAFENLSRRQLEVLQMWGYVKVFVANRRWGDFARFAWKYRTEGMAVALKILLGPAASTAALFRHRETSANEVEFGPSERDRHTAPATQPQRDS